MSCSDMFAMSLFVALLTTPAAVASYKVMFDKDKVPAVSAVGKNLLEVRWRHTLLGDVEEVRDIQVMAPLSVLKLWHGEHASCIDH